jgi:predicted TIM-barrel fold metal-dependent hydrolase
MTVFTRLSVSFAAALLCAGAFAAPADTYTDADFTKVEKIDAHMHLHGALPLFMQRAQQDNVRILTINVDYPDFPALPEQERVALDLHKRYPHDVAFATTFATDKFETPGWAKATNAQLDRTLAAGAVGVKVWKNLGMHLRDHTGKAVLIDDPRLKPVFDHLEGKGTLVLIHQAEPLNCWLPVEKMTTASDREYFTKHPQYHMFGKTEWPSHEQLLGARDHLLQLHPKMRAVGVHLASLEWDVDELAKFLERFPKASVDLSARIAHLQHQAIANRSKVRDFMIRYQDRILYGTDLASSSGQPDADFATDAHKAWVSDWAFLTSDRQLTSPELAKPFQGLALPRAVVDKIYAKNARREFPQAWH